MRKELGEGKGCIQSHVMRGGAEIRAQDQVHAITSTSEPRILEVYSPYQQHQGHLDTCWKCRLPGPTADLLNPKSWIWGPAAGIGILTSPLHPGDSDAHSNVETPDTCYSSLCASAAHSQMGANPNLDTHK